MKKQYISPVSIVIALPHVVLLTESFDPHDEPYEYIDVPYDAFPEDPDDGTFEAL